MSLATPWQPEKPISLEDGADLESGSGVVPTEQQQFIPAQVRASLP